MIERITTSGEKIKIFDDVFTALEGDRFEGFASSCAYQRIQISSSTHNSRSKNETFFGCKLAENDLFNFGLLNSPGMGSLSTALKGLKIERAWILCAESSTKYTYHSDSGNGGFTLLYYINTFWDANWGGETLFCNDKGEPEIAVACKPNRVVIFPSHIFHKPSGITRDARVRYTVTITFGPSTENDRD